MEMKKRAISGIGPATWHYKATKVDTHLVEGREVCGAILEDVLGLVAEDLPRKVV